MLKFESESRAGFVSNASAIVRAAPGDETLCHAQDCLRKAVASSGILIPERERHVFSKASFCTLDTCYVELGHLKASMIVVHCKQPESGWRYSDRVISSPKSRIISKQSTVELGVLVQVRNTGSSSPIRTTVCKSPVRRYNPINLSSTPANGV